MARQDKGKGLMGSSSSSDKFPKIKFRYGGQGATEAEAEAERIRMTASHRRRRVMERDTDLPVVDEIPHIDHSSRSMAGSIRSAGADSRIPYDGHEEEHDHVESDFDDVPVPAARARKSRYEFDTFSGPLELHGPAPRGPTDWRMIPSFKSHIAYYIWAGHERSVGRCESRITALNAFKKHELKQLMAPYGQDELELLEASGLDSLEYFYIKNVDKGLMGAFIERWQPETNSFHMPWGEMTITLHDVHLILGLRVDGLAVHGDSVEERPMCELLLAEVLDLDMVEPHAKLGNSGIKWSEFVERVRSRSRTCRQKVIGYLTFLIGMALFPDRSVDRFKPTWMRYSSDLEHVGEYAWGAAVLAHLYRQLGLASRAHVKGLQGCTLLLQCWIYEYFRPFRAPINSDYREMQPRFLKWKPRKGISDLLSVRRMLDDMQADQIDWMPYGPHVHRRVPRTLYYGCIQFMEIVEPYLPDRVLRQFGFRQTIPQCYIQSREPCLRGPLGGQTYQVRYDPPGQEWMDLATSSITLDGRTLAWPPSETATRYME
ncbi:PREDICTED: serine/threonine-protein phosphatase 7 long form homolog [Erythranthe guttata]|uniref:serine/threonine-protein phosphatase 7 long form homolog n=1 Tax=Erythranthe guttata TaxID=4155 RepID=UPI00064DFAD4|nr:PREDICTED: serine/threonine-protein phosphatase 7 long form homolog [Erythranthe guttata]|eukprot:XP_012828838.1 PREDICTED: serine/threonine-protein phosphatase 7 long form homolog [Erythranthe guttata]